MKRIWNYLADVWQGDDGKLSLKRIFAISLAVEVIRMLEDNKITNEFQRDAFYAILATIVIVFGILTFAQIQSIPVFTKTTKSEETTTGTTTVTTTAITNPQ